MSASPQITAVIGRGVLPSGSLVVDADDLGLTRGLGCFDATRVSRRAGRAHVDALDAHLARLARSADALGIACPPASAWRTLVDQMLASWTSDREAALKLMLTGGPESREDEPVALATLTPLGDHALELRRGMRVVTLSRGVPHDAFAQAPWLLGGVKTLSYAVNVAARLEAERRGADDALFVSTDGYALEGPNSALVVLTGQRLRTTPPGDTGILASITVEQIFAAAPTEGLTGEFALLTPADVLTADAAWLVSSVRGPGPVRRLDGVDLPPNPAADAQLRRLAGF